MSRRASETNIIEIFKRLEEDGLKFANLLRFATEAENVNQKLLTLLNTRDDKKDIITKIFRQNSDLSKELKEGSESGIPASDNAKKYKSFLMHIATNSDIPLLDGNTGLTGELNAARAQAKQAEEDRQTGGNYKKDEDEDKNKQPPTTLEGVRTTVGFKTPKGATNEGTTK